MSHVTHRKSLSVNLRRQFACRRNHQPCTHTQRHTHTHTHTHAFPQLLASAAIPTHAHTRSHTHTHTYTPPRSLGCVKIEGTHIHAAPQPWLCACVRVRALRVWLPKTKAAGKRVCVCVCVFVCVRDWSHTRRPAALASVAVKLEGIMAIQIEVDSRLNQSK